MIYIIIIILITSITILTNGNKLGDKGTQNIINRIYVLVSSYIIYYIYIIIYKGEERRIGIGGWNIEINRGEGIILVVDSTTIIMTAIIIIIGYGIIKYSQWYLNETKFMGMLNIFIVSMLVIVSTKTILGIYMGWEWVGICSYMLINYWYRNVSNNKSGVKAIMYNKIGDIGLLVTIIILYNELSVTSSNILEYNSNSLLTIGLVIAAIVKSAQYIMHPWLGDAMAGPTPVSALLHAATMVTAGIVLLIRTMVYQDNIWDIVLYLCIITIIFGGLSSLVQNDIKKLIAYSTCSQLGYMFIILYKDTPMLFSLYHLFTHAFFKALLFICAGIVIHYCNNEQDVRRIHINNTDFLYHYLLFSSLSLLSFPFTSGYYSKESIILSTDNTYIYTLLIIGALLTILYTYKLLYMLYINNSIKHYSIYEFPLNKYVYIMPLLIGSIIIGYYTNTYYMSQYLYLIKHNIYVHILPIIGIFCYMYRGPSIYYINRTIVYIYYIINNRTFIDEIINEIVYYIIQISYLIYKYIDKGFIEYMGPRGLYRLIRRYNTTPMSIYTKDTIIYIIIIIVMTYNMIR